MTLVKRTFKITKTLTITKLSSSNITMVNRTLIVTLIFTLTDKLDHLHNALLAWLSRTYEILQIIRI